MVILTFIGGCVVVLLLSLGIYHALGWLGERNRRNKQTKKETNGE